VRDALNQCQGPDGGFREFSGISSIAVLKQKFHGRDRGGERYLCEKCGTEVLCNKPGAGAIECCEGEMKIKEAKALPSSD
jgi:hypothetical protein